MINKNQYTETLLLNWWNTRQGETDFKWAQVCRYALVERREFFMQLFDLRTFLDAEGWVREKPISKLLQIGFIN